MDIIIWEDGVTIWKVTIWSEGLIQKNEKNTENIKKT